MKNTGMFQQGKQYNCCPEFPLAYLESSLNVFNTRHDAILHLLVDTWYPQVGMK